MPWKNKTTMEQKIEFILEWRTNKYTITELCKVFEISRVAGYNLITRFENYGLEGLRAQSKTPKSHPKTTPEHIVKAILDLKEKHPRWGG